jgi:FkbH-like protein
MPGLTQTAIASRRSRGLELQRRPRGELPSTAVVSTFNIDLASPFLIEALDRHDLDREIYVGPFGALQSEILDPGAELYRREPQEVVLVPSAEDLLAPLYDPTSERFDGGRGQELVDERLSQLGDLVDAVLDRLPGAGCFVVAMGGHAPNQQVLNPLAPERGQGELGRYLDGVRALAARSPRVVTVDWEWQVSVDQLGPVRDERLWYLARMRLDVAGLAALADLVARHVAAYRSSPRKVIAVDLDDTLWGGVVGEVGVGGLVLGEEGVGMAFRDFQMELLRLRSLGVMLAICSKNNEEDALEAIDGHPAMVLRREHFSAVRINWDDKAANLRELADELNVGLDSVVFLDDNPVERQWVRESLPEVLVPDLPEDPVYRPSHLAAAPWFDVLSVTDADRIRVASREAESERTARRTAAPSFDEYLASLEQEVTIEPMDEHTLTRAAQLSARTNQFNLTTRRETAGDLERMAAADDFDVLLVGVRDRFGDSGLTGLTIMRLAGDSGHVDTFLLSCRVLGRKVEDAVLAYLARRASTLGARYLVGYYDPTDRNRQADSFYPDRGFEAIGESAYRRDIATHPLDPPGMIELRETARA